MRRMLLFLTVAIFMALIVQPNLNSNLSRETSSPVNTKDQAKTNDDIDIGRSESQKSICLDAANGGEDTGYILDADTVEKNLNLNIVKALGNYLSQAGYNVTYTRSDDSTIVSSNEVESAKERIQIAKNNEADYLISIQLSNDLDPTVNGYSFYTHPEEELIDLANVCNEQLMSINYSHFAGLDTDHYENFPILKDRSIPTLMIQLGYMTNTSDLANLTDEDFQQLIAKALASAILEVIN